MVDTTKCCVGVLNLVIGTVNIEGDMVNLGRLLEIL
jgi:hypothetical protein